jgi:transporter family protein
MDRWIVYSFVSMAFAGFMSVIAKLGLTRTHFING